jgi:hypothetical protein
MIFVEKKPASIFGLINSFELVNSDYLLERERERERERAGSYNNETRAKENKNKSYNQIFSISDSVFSETEERKINSRLHHFIQIKVAGTVLFICRQICYAPLREDYVRTDPPFL